MFPIMSIQEANSPSVVNVSQSQKAIMLHHEKQSKTSGQIYIVPQRHKISDNVKGKLIAAYETGKDYLALGKQMGIKKSTIYTIIRRAFKPNDTANNCNRTVNQNIIPKETVYKSPDKKSFSSQNSCKKLPASNADKDNLVSSKPLESHQLATTSTILHSLLVEQSSVDSSHLSAFKRYDNYDQNELRRRANSLSLPHGTDSAFRPRSATNTSLSNKRYNPYPVCSSEVSSVNFSSYSTIASVSLEASLKKNSAKKLNPFSESLLKDALTGKSLQPDVTKFYHVSQPFPNSCHFQPPPEPPPYSRNFSQTPKAATSNAGSSIVESILAQDSSNIMDFSRDTSRHNLAVQSSIALVQLAKKNLFPVQSRISELLKLNAAFLCQKIENFKNLSEISKLTILNKVWHRLLILSMIQYNFSFTVSEQCKSHKQTNSIAALCDDNGSPAARADIQMDTEPTMLFTHELKEVISEGNNLKMSTYVFDLLRLSVISQFCYPTYFKTSYSDIMKLLSLQLSNQDYAQILLIMTKLYHFESEIIRKLFCTHLPAQLTVEAAILSVIES